MKKALNFTHNGNRGTVHSVRAHENGTHAVVTVRHKPMKKAKDGYEAFGPRHESEVMVPMAKAKHYFVGQKVGAGVAPLGTKSGQTQVGDGDMDENGRDGVDRMMMNLRSRPRRSKGGGKLGTTPK